MSEMAISIATMLIWIAVSREAIKPSKEVNWRKTITLMSAGSVFTLVLTISRFQNIPFF